MLTRLLIAVACILPNGKVPAEAPLDWNALAIPNAAPAKFDESMIPQVVQAYMGRPISIRGYMHPNVPYATNNKHFILCAETNAKGHKALRASVHPYIVVEMVGEARADFTVSPLLLHGELRINVYRDADGKVLSVYKLKATSVAKAPQRPGYYSVGDWQSC